MVTDGFHQFIKLLLKNRDLKNDINNTTDTTQEKISSIAQCLDMHLQLPIRSSLPAMLSRIQT